MTMLTRKIKETNRIIKFKFMLINRVNSQDTKDFMEFKKSINQYIKKAGYKPVINFRTSVKK